MKPLHTVAVVVVSFLFVCACSGDDDGSPADPAGSSGRSGNGGSANESSCEHGCEATLEADCPNGPGSHAECVEDCESLSSDACGLEYAELQACAAGKTITCSNSGIPFVEACSEEQDAFIECMSRPSRTRGWNYWN